MPKYKLIIEYDGTNYCGWQRQKSPKPSIQQTIEDILFNITGNNCLIYGAGRTDSGVHAKGQVAHVELALEWQTDKLRQAINAHCRLGKHLISIVQVTKVNPDFHARFSALKRHYQYQILNRPSESPLLNKKAWHVFKNLNIELMQQACSIFIGKYDFTSFRAKQCQAKNPIISIDSFTVIKQDEVILINISARSFLHHMVRNLVGSLKQIGEEKLTLNELQQILKACDRNLAPATAPAHGLYFSKVEY